MQGYRQGAEMCQLCCKELAAGEALAEASGLMSCPGCRDGIPRAAGKVWRLQLRAAEEHHGKHTRAGSPHMHATVQVGLPTEIAMSGEFRGRDFGGASSGGNALTQQLLSDAAVDQCLRAAMSLMGWGSVKLDPIGVTLEAHARSFTADELGAIDRAAVVLAVAIERWVRGAPGSAPQREACIDRPQEAKIDANVPREAPLPWIPPDSSLRKKAKAGPDCPACGESTTDALTEYICLACGHTVDRPKVREQLRKRNRRNAVIVTAIVFLVLAGLIASIIVERT